MLITLLLHEQVPVATWIACGLAASALIIIVFCAAGKLIFTMFGITLPAFRITGGILVALVGFHMLQGGENSSVQHPSEGDKETSLRAALDKPFAQPMLKTITNVGYQLVVHHEP